ncbi:MAG: hypothetical protein ACYC7A_06460 [Thermoanaerobaculia bacterium]
MLLLLAICTALFADVLFVGKHFYIRDLTRFYFPTKQIIREILLAGDFPSWNPVYAAGQPLAANPEYEVFYPPQWLILLPSYDLGYRLHIVVHVFLAAIGMYLLLRSMQLKIPGSFFGGLVFGLGGIVMSNINLLPILFCAVWMPLIFLFARRFLIAPNLRDFALAALFAGLQMLPMEPTTLVQTWFLIGCYALYRAWYDHRSRIRGAVRNTLLVALLLLGGVSVGGVQLLPAFDHAADSARARKFDFGLVTAWSLPYVRPVELLFPHVFGRVSRGDAMLYWGGGMYKGMGSPFFFSIYLGLLTAGLVIGAAFTRPRSGRFVLAIGAVSLLLALGGHTPLFRWLYDIGLAGSVRYPEKWSLMGLLVLIIFAAKMLDRCVEGDRKLLDATIGVLAGVTIFALLVAALGMTPWYGELFTRLWALKGGGSTATYIEISRNDWWIAFIRGSLFVGLLMLLRAGFRGRWWQTGAVILVIADLAPVGYSVSPRMPARFFTPPAIEATLDRDKDAYRVFHEIDWYGTSDIAKKYFSTGAGVYWVVRNGIYPMTTASWGIRTVLERDYDKTELLPTIDLVESMWKVRDAGQQAWPEIFMAMSNARFRSEYVPFDGEAKRIGRDFTKSQPVVFRRVEGNERYYFADEIVQTRDRQEFVDKLVAKRWSPRVAFVSAGAFAPAGGRVIGVAERSNRFTVDVEAGGRALLVMSVTTHKYWKAKIDGAPAPLKVVNLGYQGIEVPQGRHRVEMRYENPIVKATGIIAIISAMILIGCAIASKTRDIPETHHQPEDAADVELPALSPVPDGPEPQPDPDHVG